MIVKNWFRMAVLIFILSLCNTPCLAASIPPVDRTFTLSGVSYYITSNENERPYTVSITRNAGEHYAGMFFIYETVKYGSKTYTVTGISAQTFVNTYQLEVVFIPNTVTTIGTCAFENSGLNFVTIPASVTEMADRVFYDCKKLNFILAEMETPVDLSSSPSVFYNVDMDACTLSVPIGTKELYAAADQWKDFNIIIEHDSSLVSKIEPIQPIIESNIDFVSLNITGMNRRNCIINYNLPKRSSVSMDFYNLKGRIVFSPVEGMQQPGCYSVRLGALSRLNEYLILVFRAGNYRTQKKLLFVR